jgi:hypothetical protein
MTATFFSSLEAPSCYGNCENMSIIQVEVKNSFSSVKAPSWRNLKEYFEALGPRHYGYFQKESSSPKTQNSLHQTD